MPTYEYECTKCGERLEAVQSFTDDPLDTCPKCGGPLRKVFGSIGIVLKGSGFYKTDSRAHSKNGASNERDGAGADKKAHSESASGGSSKSDGSPNASPGKDGSSGGDSSAASGGKASATTT